MKKIILIDLMNIFVKTSYVCNYDVEEHLYYLINYIRNIYKNKQYDDIYLVLEGSSQLNKTKLKTYKQGRLKKEGILDNMRVFISVVSQYVKVVRNKEIEGDLTLANLALYFNEKGYEVTIFSNDKDFLQLAQFNILIADKIKNGKAVVLTEEEILMKFKNSKKEPLDKLENILKYRVFKGDTSDRIPSAVTGLQDRFIREIINYWEGTNISNNVIDKMIENVSNEKVKKMLDENRDSIIRNFELMNLTEINNKVIRGIKLIKQPIDEKEIRKWKVRDWQLNWLI